MNFITQLRDSTLTHRASGADLDRLAMALGLRRPGSIRRSRWREVLRILGYGYRGRPGSTRAAVQAALADYQTEIEVTISGTNPTRLTAPTGSFTQDLVGRDVIVEGRRHRVSGPYDVDVYSGAYLFLSPYSTSIWEGCAFSGSSRTVTATFLSFTAHEEGGVFRVWTSPLADDVPPTYLVEDDDDRIPGQPEGGFLMEDALDLGEDTFPLYLPGMDNELGEVLSETLPAGWVVELESRVPEF